MNYLKKAAVCMTAAAMFAANSVGFMPYNPIELPAITANAADVVASGECGLKGNNVTWTLDSEGTLTISGEGEMNDYVSNYKTPWSSLKYENVVIENGITSIGENAFSFCYALTSISLPDSVTSIGNSAFSFCDNLTTITIPDSVTSIGEKAFYDCPSLESITIPDSVTSIGEKAFYDCSSLESITIPDGVTSIPNSAFFRCNKLKSVKIPDSVTSIGEEAFESCTNLQSINIPNSVTSIGAGAFSLCQNLTSISIPSSVLTIENETFGYCSNLTTLNIADGVKEIKGSPFIRCKSLTSLVIPNGVTSIERFIFSELSGLTSITLSESVEIISPASFDTCPNLAEIIIKNPECEIHDSTKGLPSKITIYGYTGSTAQEYAEKYNRTFIALDDEKTSAEIVASGECGAEGDNVLWELDSEGTLTISGEGAMDNWSLQQPWYDYMFDVVTVEIKSGVTSIGEMAFNNFTDMTSISIPDSVTSIGKSAFFDCHSLTSIEIPAGVTVLDTSVFYSCTSLTSVTLSENIQELKFGAFQNCKNLNSITFNNPECTIYDYKTTICNSYDYETDETSFNGTIYGYTGSTAQAYAEKYGRTFVALDEKPAVTTTTTTTTAATTTTTTVTTAPTPDVVLGDVDNNGILNTLDASYIMEHLQAFANGQESILTADQQKAADTNSDGCINSYDIYIINRVYAAFQTGAITNSIPEYIAENFKYKSAVSADGGYTAEEIAASPVKPTLSVADVEYKLDELAENGYIAEVTISADGFDNATALDFHIYYDEELTPCYNESNGNKYLKVNSLGGAAYCMFSRGVNEENNSIFLSLSNTRKEDINGEIIKLYFNVPKDVQPGAEFEVYSEYTNGDMLACGEDNKPHAYLFTQGLNGGSISITGEAVTTTATTTTSTTTTTTVTTTAALSDKSIEFTDVITEINSNYIIFADNGKYDFPHNSIPDLLYGFKAGDTVAVGLWYTETETGRTINYVSYANAVSIATTTTATTTAATTTSTETTTTTPPTTTEPAFTLGDVDEDGKVDSVDASLVLAEYALIQTGGKLTFTETQKKAADVNNDGKTDSSDASKILEYYAAVSIGKKPTWD